MKQFSWRMMTRAGNSGRVGFAVLAALLLVGAASGLALTLGRSAYAAGDPSEAGEVPHLIQGHEACGTCHEYSAVRPIPDDHARYDQETCLYCHQPAPSPPAPPADSPGGDAYCLNCHDNPAMAVQLGDGQTLSLHVDARELTDSVHKSIGCTSCHRDIGAYPHAPTDLGGSEYYRERAVSLCIDCHATVASAYASSVHGEPLLTRAGPGAACYDCHSDDQSGHSVHPVTGPEALVLPWTLMPNCGRCHPEELDSYLETSHSKVVRFGNPQGAAICITCHGAHDAKRVDDPEVPLTPENLVDICDDCHAGATKSFAAGWVGHRGASATRFPGVYFTERLFVFLTVIVVGLGIVHVELDLFRWLSNRLRHRRKGD